MNLFQILALIVIAALLLVSVVAVSRGSVARRDGAFWILLWVAAGAAIAWPGITQVAARILGIRRGADLVLYCSVVIMMVGFLMTYSRLRKLRRELTLMVRHVAKRDAVVNPPTDEVAESADA